MVHKEVCYVVIGYAELDSITDDLRAALKREQTFTLLLGEDNAGKVVSLPHPNLQLNLQAVRHGSGDSICYVDAKSLKSGRPVTYTLEARFGRVFIRRLCPPDATDIRL